MNEARYEFGAVDIGDKEVWAENAAYALALAMRHYARGDVPVDSEDRAALIESARNLFERDRRVAL